MVKKYALLFFSLFVMIITSRPSYSLTEGTTIRMIDMHISSLQRAEIVKDGIEDSYGNLYTSNVIQLDAGQSGYITYDLNGKYNRFRGTIASSTQTSSSALIDIGIFADGKLVFSATEITRQHAGKNFDIDISGVRTLEIKTAPSNLEAGWDELIYFVNSEFTETEKAQPYTVWSKLNDLPRIDTSREFKAQVELAKDTFGNLHNGAQIFTATREDYVLYNLNKQYETFTAGIVASPLSNQGLMMQSEAILGMKIFLDGRTAFFKKGLKKSDKQVNFSLDVSGVSVLKIVTSYTAKSSPRTGYLMLVDDILKPHEHVLGNWVITKQASCTEAGVQERSCSKCGEKIETEVIMPKGHTADGKWIREKDPSCSDDGLEINHCSVCGEVFEHKTLAKLPHTPAAEWTLVRDTTCGADGIQAKICTACGEYAEEKLLPKLAHTYGDWKHVRGSVWDNPIVEERTCSVCGIKEQSEHSPTPWLKPLILTVLLVIMGGIVLIGVTLRMNGMSLHPSNIKKLFSRDTVSDEDVEDLLKK